MKGAFEVMSEQREMRFTKVSGGKMYLSEEVDGYIEILRNAYSEVLTELESVKEQSAKSQESFTKEQEQSNQVLKSERAKQQEKLAKLNASLQQEQEAKEATMAQLKELEKLKLVDKENIEKVNKMLADGKNSKNAIQQELADTKEQKDILQQELADTKEQKTTLQQQLAKAKVDNDRLQQEKVMLEENANSGSLGNADDYISLLKRTADTADTYVRDIEEKMSQLEDEAKTRCETQISQAHQESANIIEDANSKALNMIKKAENKRQEILTRTRTEYEGIRGLIEQASKEYGEMASNAKEEELEWDS